MEKIIHLQILLYCMAAAGLVGAAGLLATNFTYRRIQRNESHLSNSKERWLLLCRKRDRLLHRMNRFVWYPAVASTAFFLLASLLQWIAKTPEGLSVRYVYLLAGVPLMLLLLRTCVDISFKEEKALQSLADYVEHPRRALTAAAGEVAQETRQEARPEKKTESRASLRAAKAEKKAEAKARAKVKEEPVQTENLNEREQEKALENITEAIRQTAATDSKFKKMLTPEETEIMKEIIREFMD